MLSMSVRHLSEAFLWRASHIERSDAMNIHSQVWRKVFSSKELLQSSYSIKDITAAETEADEGSTASLL